MSNKRHRAFIGEADFACGLPYTVENGISWPLERVNCGGCLSAWAKYCGTFAVGYEVWVPLQNIPSILNGYLKYKPEVGRVISANAAVVCVSCKGTVAFLDRDKVAEDYESCRKICCELSGVEYTPSHGG